MYSLRHSTNNVILAFYRFCNTSNKILSHSLNPLSCSPTFSLVVCIIFYICVLVVLSESTLRSISSHTNIFGWFGWFAYGDWYQTKYKHCRQSDCIQELNSVGSLNLHQTAVNWWNSDIYKWHVYGVCCMCMLYVYEILCREKEDSRSLLPKWFQSQCLQNSIYFFFATLSHPHCSLIMCVYSFKERSLGFHATAHIK